MIATSFVFKVLWAITWVLELDTAALAFGVNSEVLYVIVKVKCSVWSLGCFERLLECC